MDPTSFEDRRRFLVSLVRSRRFLHGRKDRLSRIGGVEVCAVTLDEALDEITRWRPGQRSVFGEEMSFSDDKSRLLSKCKRALYAAPDSREWTERIYAALRDIGADAQERVEEQGGEPGVAGEIVCHFQMLLLLALFGDAALAEVEGAAAHLALVLEIYDAGGLPMGWRGLFPSAGTFIVRCDP